MRYRSLGSSGATASVLGMGALHFGIYLDAAESERLVHEALDLGVTFFDTAPLYGRGESESHLGRALAGRRQRLIISTKVGLAPATLPDGRFSVTVTPLNAAQMRISVEQSLHNLGIETIDLLQLHAFDPHTPLSETFEAVTRLVAEGKVRWVGCSNYSEEQLEEAAASGVMPFVAFQCHYNMVERRAGTHIAPACQRYGLGILCNRALARGILTARYRPGAPPPSGSRGADSERVRHGLTPELLTLILDLDAWARDHGHTVTELALAWLLTQPGVSVALAGTRTSCQLAACARAADWELSTADLEAVDDIVAAHGLTERIRALPQTFFET